MFGEMLFRPGSGLVKAPDAPFYCDDWSCPASGVCEHHFGRSYAYAAMIVWWDGKDKTPFFTPTRPPFSATCEHFRRDKPREWLKGWCSTADTVCPGCEAPECPNAPSNVTTIARGSA